MDEADQLIPILIVDDNQDNLLVHEAVLRQKERDIKTALSGEEALALIEKQEFAVVILDIQMPVMDGYEVARRVREMKLEKSPPIIFVTAGMNENALILQGYSSGAVDYLFKPVEPQILRSKVDIFTELFKARKQIEKQSEMLRRNDQEARDLFLEQALDAVVAMNENGDVVYWNHQAEVIFGYKKNEAIGKRLSSLIIPERYRLNHEKGLAHFLKTGEGPILNTRIEINALRKNGSEFPAELSVSPIASGSAYTFGAFVRDISERKAEQQNLRKAISARDEFISVCSHELKTPLTSMQLQFQLAYRMYKNHDERVFEKETSIRRLENANKQILRMGNLIENMLDVSKISSGKLHFDKNEIDLLTILNEVVDSFREQFEEKKIQVNIYNKSAGPLMIFADSYRMEQVISNLITNAMKYGDNKPIDVLLNKVAGRISLSIIDHGLGIDSTNLHRIFDRYERAIDASEISGLGLGLYISKQIVEAHDGKLTVQSEKGVGSVFTVEIPEHRAQVQLSH